MARRLVELKIADEVAAGAVGEPGKRTFYLRAREGANSVNLWLEKEQLQALALGIRQVLGELAEQDPSLAVADDIEPPLLPPFGLNGPFDVEFRVAQLALGYDATQDLLRVSAVELAEEEDAAMTVRFGATRDQMNVLSLQALVSAAAGRPLCSLCGRPIDREGHFCPRRNGHSRPVDAGM